MADWFDRAGDSSVLDMAAGWSLDSEQPEAEAPAVSGPTSEARPLTSIGVASNPGWEFSLHLGPPSAAEEIGAIPAGSRSDELSAFPKLGELLAQFRIVSELGRGAFARVYLAEDTALADRPVALKVSAALGDEPQNLARLQHAHIVPIHSVHDDPSTGLRLICMPYVGGANLAQVLQTAETRSYTTRHHASQATGWSLIEALDQLNEASLSTAGNAAPRIKRSLCRVPLVETKVPDLILRDGSPRRRLASPSQVRSNWGRYLARFSWWAELEQRQGPILTDESEPARRYLRSATFVQAGIWIAARLAEALEHAHERGIMHRDIKPSNVLIAADGSPMLLDFNLSANTTSESGARAQLGGTLPYMAPEHLDAFDPESRTPPDVVGPMADVYSLGLILFEMVAGAHPFPDPPDLPCISETIRSMIAERMKGAPSARLYNPLVPWSVESILRKCLAPDRSERYQSARDLAEDLRRVLDDQPLKHAPELSLRERGAKWSRRHPRATSSTTIGAVAFGTLLAVGGAGWKVRDHLETSAARLHFQQFTKLFRTAQLELNVMSASAGTLDRGVGSAERALAAYEVDRTEQWITRPRVMRLPVSEQKQLLEQVAELIELRERVRVLNQTNLAGPERLKNLETAVSWLDAAERIDPRPSFALYSERSAYLNQLGRNQAAERDRQAAMAHLPTSARDHYLLGTSYLARGLTGADKTEFDRAEIQLTKAVGLDPQRFWSWFTLGLCHYLQGRYLEASGNFETCITLAPEFAWPHLNRGLALAAANRLTEARLAYDQALRVAPDFVEALVDRALTCLELGDAEPAERDLARALSLGDRKPEIVAAHAEALARLGRREQAETEFAEAIAARPDDIKVHVARGFSRLRNDPVGAAEDFSAVLKRAPRDSRALLGKAHLVRADDPRAAIAYCDRALAADSAFGDALQLRALLRGQLGDRSTVADVDRLERIPTPYRLYNAACAMALLARATSEPNHAARACELLGRAIAVGFDPAIAANDPDLESLRDRPAFRRLVRPR